MKVQPPIVVAGAALALAGCVTSDRDTSDPPATEICVPDNVMPLCRAEKALELPLEWLRQRDKLSLTCEWWSLVDASYEEQCHDEIRGVIATWALRFTNDLEPIEFEKLRFVRRSDCIDTFIPGREAADCFDYLVVDLPLAWKPKIRSETDP